MDNWITIKSKKGKVDAFGKRVRALVTPHMTTGQIEAMQSALAVQVELVSNRVRMLTAEYGWENAGKIGMRVDGQRVEVVHVNKSDLDRAHKATLSMLSASGQPTDRVSAIQYAIDVLTVNLPQIGADLGLQNDQRYSSIAIANKARELAESVLAWRTFAKTLVMRLRLHGVPVRDWAAIDKSGMVAGPGNGEAAADSILEHFGEVLHALVVDADTTALDAVDHLDTIPTAVDAPEATVVRAYHLGRMETARRTAKKTARAYKRTQHSGSIAASVQSTPDGKPADQ